MLLLSFSFLLLSLDSMGVNPSFMQGVVLSCDWAELVLTHREPVRLPSSGSTSVWGSWSKFGQFSGLPWLLPSLCAVFCVHLCSLKFIQKCETGWSLHRSLLSLYSVSARNFLVPAFHCGASSLAHLCDKRFHRQC